MFPTDHLFVKQCVIVDDLFFDELERYLSGRSPNIIRVVFCYFSPQTMQRFVQMLTTKAHALIELEVYAIAFNHFALPRITSIVDRQTPLNTPGDFYGTFRTQIHGAFFTTAFHPTVVFAPSLKRLRLSHVSHPLPTNLSHFTALTHLRVDESDIDAPLIRSLTTLPQLLVLQFSYCIVQDPSSFLQLLAPTSPIQHLVVDHTPGLLYISAKDITENLTNVGLRTMTLRKSPLNAAAFAALMDVLATGSNIIAFSVDQCYGQPKARVAQCVRRDHSLQQIEFPFKPIPSPARSYQLKQRVVRRVLNEWGFTHEPLTELIESFIRYPYLL